MIKACVIVISVALLLPLFVYAQSRNPTPGSVFAPKNPDVANALDAGAAAFRAGDYEAARVSFEKVVKLAPSLAVGHLYLGTVYAALMNESEPGKAYGDSAVREFKIYLTAAASNRSALVLLGQVYWKQGAYQDALNSYRAAERQESGFDTAYAIGAVNRSICQDMMFGKKEVVNVDETPSLVTPESCPRLRKECLPKIDEGIDYTQAALRMKPDYTDAVLEMMLLFDFRSRLQCGDKNAQKNDHEQSLMWRRKLQEHLPDAQHDR